MKRKLEICYMCNAIATSEEHVPPKCIFPERKDLPNKSDLRKQLFTVPACDTHNSKKSHDDEYFLYVLGMSIQINETGRNHYKSKIRRAIKRNPSLLRKFANTAVSVVVSDPYTQKEEQSYASTLDADRFNRIIGQISRAIYYFHNKEKWIGNVKYQAEFLAATTDQADESNIRIKAISAEADEMFSCATYHGSNPEVFKYQAIQNSDSKKMRLHFYGGCKLLLIFNSA